MKLLELIIWLNKKPRNERLLKLLRVVRRLPASKAL
jgi:hypothetical protein